MSSTNATPESPAKPIDDALASWLAVQTRPFTLFDAARRGLDVQEDKITPAFVTRLGIELRKAGCKPSAAISADGQARQRLYSPPSMRKTGPDTRKIPRQNVFIGTTNEADYLSVPDDAFFTTPRRSQPLDRAFHDRPGRWRNLWLVTQNLIRKIAEAINDARRPSDQHVK